MTINAPRPIPPTRTTNKSLSRTSIVFILGIIAASVINGALIKAGLYIADANDLLSWWQSIALGLTWITFRFIDATLFKNT